MELAQRVLDGPPLSEPELLRLLGPEVPLLPLLHESRIVRERFFGNRVKVHILNNAQNARCPEDCGYCSQSAVTDAPLRPYPWKSKAELVEEAKKAYACGAFRYCMVASGRGPADRQIDYLVDVVETIRAEVPVNICVSVGLLDDLFVVAACLSRLVNHVHPDVVRANWSGQGDALEIIQSTTAWFERELRLRVGDSGEDMELPAEVVSANVGADLSSRTTGMGVKFSSLSPEQQAAVDRLFERARAETR